jgi:hypothetical protein
MKTSAMLPVGEKSNYVIVKKGDILELVTGEKITFVEMARTKWHGLMNGKGIVVPIYRNKSLGIPYVKAVIGKDASVIVPATKINTFKPGDLFFIEGHKETFMYKGQENKKNGKLIIKGRDLATTKIYNIDAMMKVVKIDLNKIKKELVKA